MSQITTKITVKVYEPLLASFNEQIDRLFIKKDAFLNCMIKEELKHLAEDLKGKKLSARGKRYISGELKRMGTHPVNIVVEKATAEMLSKVVDETNIVRDAFINRLILLLRSSDAVLKYLELPEHITYSEFESYVEPMPTSPMKALEAVHGDPLFYLRIAARERFDTGLYLLSLPSRLVGFSCYLEDVFIPGTVDYKSADQELSELLTKLDTLEEEAFGSHSPSRGEG